MAKKYWFLGYLKVPFQLQKLTFVLDENTFMKEKQIKKLEWSGCGLFHATTEENPG
jgi:hypothetical protein